MNLLLVGCGKMGGAMLSRWQSLALCDGIAVIEPSLAGLAVNQAQTLAELDNFTPDTVVFAVKPQTLPDMIGDYRAMAERGVLFISIAAGKPLAFFEQHLGASAKVVRSMPNLPASIGRGVTVACANKNVTADEKKRAEKLLAAVGDVLWVDDEALLNPVTALSGSGPAYVFLLIEAMTTAGIKTGLSPAMAAQLARQTVIGSAALAAGSTDSASTLRDNVTSPGGTTAAALDILMASDGIQQMFDRALAAATKRAEELSK
jgi:pyrroline-5-carboxylate reductase